MFKRIKAKQVEPKAKFKHKLDVCKCSCPGSCAGKGGKT